MDYTEKEVLQFIEENDVKFVRLAFTDLFGVMKNISIMSDQIKRAFSEGISFDASAVKGFLNTQRSDLFLKPDPATLAVLPWRPQQGRVVRMLSNIVYPDGEPFEASGRHLLKQAMRKALNLGLTVRVGPECEFYLFEQDEKGNPTDTPQDKAGYFDVAPYDKGENVRREICFALEEMGIRPESSHHEQGPGQNEIDFQYSDALQAADNFMTFKAAVKTSAARNGLYASFMPKPLIDGPGNGMHINLSLLKNGINIFRSGRESHSPEAESFIAGILRRIREITLFLNPLTNSYRRFGNYEAPRFISWSHQNRSQLIRIPAAKGEFARMELRSPDGAINPYLAFTLLIEAGISGVEEKLELCEPIELDLLSKQPEGIETLPQNLKEAIECARTSEFVKKCLPKKLLDCFIEQKQEEWSEYREASDAEAFEKKKYFYII